MAINFPSNPSVNDTFTVDDKTFLWTGEYWRTLSSAVTFPGIIKDADNDTKIQVEETADDDTIRFDTAGAERMTIASDGTVSISGNLIAKEAVVPYADSSARTTAIPTPTEGQMSYLQDANSVEVYDGTQWTAIAGGPIVQMVVATTTTSTTTTSTTYVDTTLSASITPTDSSSNIYVLMTGHVRPRRTAADNSGWGYMNIVRGTTQIAETASRIDVGGTGTTQQQSPAAVSILDSPATTSATTYKVQIKSSSPAETVFSGQGFASTITLIEVSS